MRSLKSKKLLLAASLSAVMGIVGSNTAAAASIYNPKSTYAHTVDGVFTDWTSPTPASYEWFDIVPQTGLYSNLYTDYDGSTLYIMNDWYVNTAGADPTNYNYFKFQTSTDVWELYVYGDGSTTLTKNGAPDPSATGAYSFGPSPLEPTDHTMWEVSINVGPGTIYMDPADPKGGGTPSVNPPVKDPALEVVKIIAHNGGGTTTSVVPEPASAFLFLSGIAGLAVARRRFSSK